MKFNQTHFRKSAHHTETNPHQRSGGNDKMDHSFSNNVGGIVYTTYTTHSAHQHQLIDASHVPAIRTDPRVAFGKSLLCIISEGTILAGVAPAVNHKAFDSLTRIASRIAGFRPATRMFPAKCLSSKSQFGGPLWPHPPRCWLIGPVGVVNMVCSFELCRLGPSFHSAFTEHGRHGHTAFSAAVSVRKANASKTNLLDFLLICGKLKVRAHVVSCRPGFEHI